MQVLINTVYVYLLAGLLVSAVEAILLVRYAPRTPSRRTTLLAGAIYLALAVVVWPYVLFLQFRGGR